METVYLLPGTMCTDKLWYRVKPLLDSSVLWHPLALPEQDSIDHMAADILTQLPKDNISIVGFSLGGYMAAHLATHFAQRFSKVCLISNSPCPLSQHELSQRRQTLAWLEKYNYQGITTEKAGSYIDGKHLAQDKVAEIINTIKHMDKALGQRVLMQQLTATSEREDLATGIINAELPFSFVCSQSDPLINSTWLQNLASNTNCVNLITTNGCGHMLPLEQPQFIADTLNLWLHNQDI